MKRMNFEGNKESRKAAALQRQEARNKLNATQQLQRLDQVFGVGQGAVRERARLAKLKE